MKIKYLFFLIALPVLLLASCGDSSLSGNSDAPVVKESVKPVADAEFGVIEMENDAAFGTIKIELYSNLAPEMVARFKELAREGFYDGTTFHRVNQTVIQGGDPKSKDNDPSNDGTGNSDKPDVVAEFSDVPFDTGIVGAARMGNDTNSQNSQFFIMLNREAQFDKNYTVFGKVVEGMQYVRTIAGSPRSGERPIENVVVKTIRIQ